MTINGFRLPESFLQAIASGSFRREVGSWQLRSNRDAFGQELETELGEVYVALAKIKRETAELPQGFEPDGVYGESDEEMAGPGAIPDIVDFRGVVCFGMSGDGAPFCFDFREGRTEPRVIWWDDVYWRVVAPDFASFLTLFRGFGRRTRRCT
jgi:hypothetical protein